MSPGARIRALREALGQSQRDVAVRGGLSDRVVLAHLERRKSGSGVVETRASIAKGLGLTLVELDQYIAGTLPLRTAVTRSTLPRSAEAS